MTTVDGIGDGEVPVLAAYRVVKTFGQVRALRGASFEAYPGEVTALVGDNGAGKSTLIKILSGVQPPDDGELRMDGEVVRLRQPARRQGPWHRDGVSGPGARA